MFFAKGFITGGVLKRLQKRARDEGRGTKEGLRPDSGVGAPLVGASFFIRKGVPFSVEGRPSWAPLRVMDMGALF